MKRMPTRDINGKCKGPCHDRVREGEVERQNLIALEPYSEPNPEPVTWARKRNEPPGFLGGRI